MFHLNLDHIVTQKRRLLHELRKRMLNKGTFVETFVENFVETFEENFVETFVENFVETFVEDFVENFIETFVETLVYNFVHKGKSQIDKLTTLYLVMTMDQRRKI